MDLDTHTTDVPNWQNVTEHFNGSFVPVVSEVRTAIEAYLLPTICTFGLISNYTSLSDISTETFKEQIMLSLSRWKIYIG